MYVFMFLEYIGDLQLENKMDFYARYLTDITVKSSTS